MCLAEAIKARFTAKQLEKELRDLIASEVAPERQQEHKKKLNEILQIEDDARRQHALALLLIDLSTPDKLRQQTR